MEINDTALIVDSLHKLLSTMPEPQVQDLTVRAQAGWSTRNANTKTMEKAAMADYFVEQEFLVANSVSSRLKFATIIVNPGTTQQFVIRKGLDWIRLNDHELSQFDITWYTPGSLLPSVLKEFRDKNPHLIQATQLFLFPGRIDIQIDSVASPETAMFVEHYDRTFTYAFLGANSFNLTNGGVYFHFSSEIALQRAIALKDAKHKYLFLDSAKLDTISEGGKAYDFKDLLRSSHSVSIYTTASSPSKDEWIQSGFVRLCGDHLENVQAVGPDQYEPGMKQVGLRIVGVDGKEIRSVNLFGRLKSVTDRQP